MWFPVLTCAVAAVATAASFGVLSPSGADIGNDQILRIAKIAGWAVGPVMMIISLLIIGILNLIRRIIRLRKVGGLHAATVIAGIIPWLIAGWNLTAEPRYTPLARAVIDFIARPMLWGAVTSIAFAIIVALSQLLPARKK